MHGDETLLQDRDWRRRNSMWMLPVVTCCGVLTWTSFLYIGIRAKRPSWLAAAGFYGLAFVLYYILVSAAPTATDGSPDTSGWQYTAGASAFFVVWIGGIVHAAIVNRQWLSYLAAPQNPAPTSSFSPNVTTELETLDDPWRSCVSQTLILQRDVRTVAGMTAPGPMRDRLQGVADHVDRDVDECWQVARRGQRLTEARARIDARAIAQQIGRLDSSEADPVLTAAAQSLRAQLETAARIDGEVSSTYNGLLLLNARLGEIVARVSELSARSGDLRDASAADSEVESVVNELIAIREALTEMDACSPQGS